MPANPPDLSEVIIRVHACGCVTVTGQLPPNVVAGTLAIAALQVATHPAGITTGHYPCNDGTTANAADGQVVRELIAERFLQPLRNRTA
jgi:hypothetical protein